MRITRALLSMVAAGAIVAPLLVGAAAQAQVTGSVTVTAQTFNVCKGGPDGSIAACTTPAPSWSIRRDRVANVIRAVGADVVGLQEATNYSTPNGAKTQQEDIRALAATIGYAQPEFDVAGPENECKRPRDADGELSGPSPCVNTSMLLFNTATTSAASIPDGSASGGVVMAGSIASGLDAESAPRSVAWAFLQKNGSTFLAISVHTSNAKTPEGEASRVTFAFGLAPWARALSANKGFPADLPVILLADLNSFHKRQPQGAQTALVNNGWTDSFSAPLQKNISYSTINYSADKRGNPQGFPAKPKLTKKTKNNKKAAATRIDYVLGLNGVRFSRYEVVMFLNPDGTFNPDFQASDHQSVVADAVLP